MLLAIFATAPRLAVQLGAPVFYNSDSPGYVQPAYDLYSGHGLTNRLKRPAGYPLMLAATFASLGPSLLTVTAVQHGLGILIVTLTYLLGRACFNRWVGFGAGLLVAISGPHISYEHLPIPESLFILLLLGLALALARAVQATSYGPALLAGLLLALATLVKPIGQALLPVAIVLTLLRPGTRRQRLLSAALLTAAFAGFMLPSMIRNQSIYGRFSLGGSLGDSLLALTEDHHRGKFVFDGPGLPPEPDPGRLAARRIIQAGVESGASSGAVRDRIRAELGLSEEQSDGLLQQLSLEAIRRQPLVFLGTVPRSLARMYQVDERSPARFRESQRSWDQLLTLGSLSLTTRAAREDGWRQAEIAMSLYRPASLGLLLPLLGLAGLVATWGRAAPGGWAPAMVPGVLWAYVLLVHAALNGPVVIYRYIAEPLLNVMVMGAVWIGFSYAGRLRAPRPARAAASE
jgi:hypothetical protein